MSFSLMLHSLLVVHQVVFFVLLAILMVMTLSFIFRSKLLGQIVVLLEKVVFGFFGLYKCLVRPQHYSYFGIEIESKLGTAVCFSIGIWVFCLHFAFMLNLLAVGVTSYYVLASPIILYLAYPAVMYALRKKCS